MVIIKILGGFASQLGKYVFGYSLAKERNTELILDVSDYTHGYFRPFMLEKLNLPNCRIVADISSFQDLEVIEDGNQLIEVFEKEKFPNIYIYKEEIDYKKFFEKYPYLKISEKTKLLKNLSLKKETQYLINFKQNIACVESVAVHVRRGDFVTLGWQEDTTQYCEAIGYFYRKYPNVQFYFFSNDIEWVKKEYGTNDRFYFIENKNGNLGDIEDFFCLAMCKHKILSSLSGYSKYATYLGFAQYDSIDAVVLSENNNERGFKCLDEKEKKEGWETFLSLNKKSLKAQRITNVSPTINRSTVIRNEIMWEKKQEVEFWQQQYGIFEKNCKNIILITREECDFWRVNGMYLVALILSRIGMKVLYVNVNSNFKIKVNEVVDASNMDGQLLGFSLYTSKDILDLNVIKEKWDDKVADTSIEVFSEIWVCGEVDKYTKLRSNMLRSLKYNIKSAFKFPKLVFSHVRTSKYIKVLETENNVEFPQWLEQLENEEQLSKIAENHALSLVQKILNGEKNDKWCL